MDGGNIELSAATGQNFSNSAGAKSVTTQQIFKRFSVLKVKHSEDLMDCKSQNSKYDSSEVICEEANNREKIINDDSNQSVEACNRKAQTSSNKFSQVDHRKHDREDLYSAYSEGMRLIKKLKTALQVHRTKTFFRPDTVFIRGVGTAVQEIESGIQKLGQLFNSSQSTDFVVKNESKTAVLDTAMDITPPASDAGNDIGLNDSTSSRQSVQLTSANDTKVSASKSSSKKRKRRQPDWALGYSRPRKIRRSLISHFNDEDDVKDNVEEKSKKGEKEEYEVEKILDYDRIKGKCLYQVRWNGYKSDDDTWEPLENLTGCEEILLAFIRARLAERSRITDPEELKTALLPCEESLKPLLRTAFFAQLNAPAQADVDAALPAIISKKIKIKTMSELEGDIDKLVAIKDCLGERYKKAFEDLQQQLVLRECHQQRERQKAELRRWEREMSRICSDPAPLSVINDVDLTLPPNDFIYVNDYVAGRGINIPHDPVCGCECLECGQSQGSCCAKQMSSFFAYNKYGRLKVSVGTAIYECNKRCACAKNNKCLNRVVQKGRTVQLTIFRTHNNRGWGVKAGETIRAGSFVTEYVGEVISSEEAERRGQIYDARGCTYLFDLDYNKGDQNPYTVDAARHGNVSHFINHSCDPNLVVFNVWINCLDPDMPKLALFAIREIKKGEELTFDYNSPSSRSQEPTSESEDTVADYGSPSLLRTPGSSVAGDSQKGSLDLAVRKTPKRGHANGKTKCHCGAANCRKYFF
ncbi:Chromo domain [Trinorchestia longiramus]|nr:Chromo domain [Trinorchestia longiramus]